MCFIAAWRIPSSSSKHLLVAFPTNRMIISFVGWIQVDLICPRRSEGGDRVIVQPIIMTYYLRTE